MILAFLALTSCGSTWTGSIGAVLGKDNRDGRVFVREVPPDMPAAGAGLDVGDEIIAVDNTPAETMSPPELHAALAGKVGSPVKLLILRNGERRTLTIERGPLRSEAPSSP